eukprot:9107229-Heterocapsa_arctica.AAC.1
MHDVTAEVTRNSKIHGMHGITKYALEAESADLEQRRDWLPLGSKVMNVPLVAAQCRSPWGFVIPTSPSKVTKMRARLADEAHAWD